MACAEPPRPAVHHRPAVAADAPACIALRGQTRDHAISATRLAELGINAASWAHGIRNGRTPGHVAVQQGAIVGHGFGDAATGEVLVLPT